MSVTLWHTVQGGLRVGVAVVIAAGLVLTAGCTGRGGSSADESGSSQNVDQFAIVTPEKESDYGWNQQGIRAAQNAAEQLGTTLDDHSDVGYDNTETILSQVAEADNDLVIAHASGFGAAAHRVGVQTGVPTLVIDFDENVPGKVASVSTQAQQGAYLAGAAAATKTETGTVGIVASAEDLNWFLLAGGFTQGVYSVDPDIEVVIAYVGPAGYGDSAGGTSVAKQVIAAGADVIMGMGDGATVGYLQAIESADTDYELSYIATIGDVTEIVDDPSIVLTSVLWNFTDTYVQAIEDIEAGTFGEQNYELTVANGGLSLQQSESLSGEVAAAVDVASDAIESGEVTVERATDRDQVQAIIDAKGR